MAERGRKLRVLIITLGGERRKVLENTFRDSLLAADFDLDFTPGIPSRELRTRESFFRHCAAAGFKTPQFQKSSNTTLWDCLEVVPIAPGRRGSDYDVSLHYSVELWRKAKTVNRGRAVLACALAHLLALRRLVMEDFDILLEDNVRLPVESVADRMWDCIRESEREQPDISSSDSSTHTAQVHMRYFGWLGSIPNLKWIYASHVHKHDPSSATVPCPTPQDIDADLASGAQHTDETNDESGERDESRNATPKNGTKDLTKPGGNPVWGTYAYWISKEAYHAIIRTLQNDVGALLWKSKRMRYYQVKPIDKIVPRAIRSSFGNAAVQLARRPAFFRAPMLTSQIHTQWDPEFCKSTTYQLQQSGLAWTDLCLPSVEEQIVCHAMQSGVWLTPAEWRFLQDEPSAGDVSLHPPCNQAAENSK
jgi:hypothetical protein